MPDPEKPSMKERILETADRLFYLQGIRAVGVDTVASEIGISKRTLYNHFPSKDALISAYLERRFRPIPPSDKPPAEQILRTFDRLERGFADKGFRGCPFVNAVAELGTGDAVVKKIAIAFKESRRVWFRDLLKQLKVANAEGLATQLTLLVDGAIAQDLVRNDPSMARAAKDAARVLLENAGISVGEPDPAAKPSQAAKKRASKSTLSSSSPRKRGPIRRDRKI
jgi:AcrR family transcriptional regulator